MNKDNGMLQGALGLARLLHGRVMIPHAVFMGVTLLTTMAGSRSMQKTPEQLPKSRAEATNYEETSRYDEVVAFIAELQKQSSSIRVESFGKSEEGRELPLMILAEPPITNPSDARASGKPVVFVMANIHAGEVEGKEAMLHFARRVLLGDLRPLLNSLVLLIAPIYNADGNEKISVDNRTAQNGPIAGVGTRENGKGLDLNRDYMKLESTEANALIDLFNRWDPHLTVDLHTTNGSYHGYHLTYSPSLNPNADSRLIAFERARMLPAITREMLRGHRFRTYFYGNFANREALGRELNRFEGEKASETQTRVWRTFDHRPRFGNNYIGLRNRMTILSEAYSYLDFRGRVAVSEAFVEEICKYSAAHGPEMLSLIARVDGDAVAGRATDCGVEFELKELPKPSTILVGDVRRVKNPRSGKEMVAMVEEKATPTVMPEYGVFGATRSVPLPRAYLIRNDANLKGVVAKLIAHGLPVEELTEPLTTDVEALTIEKVAKEPRAFQGHQGVKLTVSVRSQSEMFPAGSILVRTSNSLGRLAFYLLDPESDDGLVFWNFLDSYVEKGKVMPIYRVSRDVRAATRLRK
jgi:hypothetical protein